MKWKVALLALLVVWPANGQQVVNEGAAVWRISTLRAAPGKWRALKALIEEQGEAGSIAAETSRSIPFRIRHSQGDHWDFMLLQPVADISEYFAAGAAHEAEEMFRAAVDELVDFSEDWITQGPSAKALAPRFKSSELFHVEMFRARAGLHDELLDQRQRENVYYQETERPGNAIWNGGLGADWDNMTIGFHESHESFARGSGLTEEAEEAAAREAGFDGASDLAPFLRSLLTGHNDTLCVKMN